MTSGLNDILYCTYNGEIELLKQVVSDEQIDEMFLYRNLEDVFQRRGLEGITALYCSKMAFDIYAINHDLDTIQVCNKIDPVTFYGMNTFLCIH